MFTPSDPLALPGAHERFTNAACEIVFRGFLALGPADQMEFAARVSATIALGSSAQTYKEKVQLATVRALHEAVAILKSTTVPLSEYRRLREKYPEQDWPADGTMRRACGGHWNDCLKLARLDPVPDGDVQVRGKGGAYSPLQLLEALSLCREQTKNRRPVESVYLGWESRPETRALPGRRPRSIAPFRRAFKRLDLAVAACAEWERTGVVPAVGVHCGEDGERVQLKPQRRFYSDAEILAWLRAARAKLTYTPTTADFRDYRSDLIAKSMAAGELVTVPDVETINARWGSWESALAEAELPLDEWRARRGRRNLDEAVVDAVLAAYVANEGHLTDLSYRTWARDAKAADPDLKAPTVGSIRKRLGNWESIRAWARDVLAGARPRELPR